MRKVFTSPQAKPCMGGVRQGAFNTRNAQACGSPCPHPGSCMYSIAVRRQAQGHGIRKGGKYDGHTPTGDPWALSGPAGHVGTASAKATQHSAARRREQAALKSKEERACASPTSAESHARFTNKCHVPLFVRHTYVHTCRRRMLYCNRHPAVLDFIVITQQPPCVLQ